MAETATKIVITLFVLLLMYWQVMFLRGVWRSQIDPKETIARLLRKLSPSSEMIAERLPNMIYQEGSEVGEVTGQIEETDDLIIFHQLCETSPLNRELPFEYRRQTVKIVTIGSMIGQTSVVSGTKSQVRSAVLENVVCKKLP